MKYLKSEQVVPGKGTAITIYEIEKDDQILRLLTMIPEVDEITLYHKPKLKKLFQPERLEEVSALDFEKYWKKGSE